MIEVRRATVEDAAELVRLREVMIGGVGWPDTGNSWQDAAGKRLRELLDTDEFGMFVVGKPDRPGELAACALGQIEYRLPGPYTHTGKVGFVSNVATWPGYRRRGYSRACMLATVEWFRRQEVALVDLYASPDGEPLYAALGFTRKSDPAMRLLLAGKRSG